MSRAQKIAFCHNELYTQYTFGTTYQILHLKFVLFFHVNFTSIFKNFNDQNPPMTFHLI